MPKATLKKRKAVRKDPIAELDKQIPSQKDLVNSLKDQYLAEYDKLKAMRAKREELRAKSE